MDLEINRIDFKKDYTISTLRETFHKNFILQVVEPPIVGLAELNAPTTYPRGRYKLFLKPSHDRNTVIPMFQAVNRYTRLAIEPSEQNLDGISFISHNGYTMRSMLIGKISNGRLVHDDYNFQRFLCRLLYAKQQREVLWVTIQ